MSHSLSTRATPSSRACEPAARTSLAKVERSVQDSYGSAASNQPAEQSCSGLPGDNRLTNMNGRTRRIVSASDWSIVKPHHQADGASVPPAASSGGGARGSSASTNRNPSSL